MTITKTPVKIDENAVGYLQNLGPDLLYLGNSSSVSPATGVRLNVGQSVTIINSGYEHYVVSEGSSDIRTMQGLNAVYGLAKESTT